MKITKILIADDDHFILDYVTRILKKENYELLTAKDGKEALVIFELEQPDLVLLDVMMPHLDGLEVCEKIRAQDPFVPILMLTAKQQSQDKVDGLQTGADDYITKPFERQELLARVERHLTRYTLVKKSMSEEHGPSLSQKVDILQVGELKVDLSSWKVFYRNESLKVSKTEFNLLKLFCEKQDQLLDRETLLREVWGYEYVGNSRTIDNFIMRLRKKLQKVLEDAGDVYPVLETVYGMGYRLKSSDSE